MNAPAHLNLDYTDPAPSPGFLERTRQQGRAIRRRRRAGAGSAVFATAALVGVLTVQFFGSSPRDLRDVADPATSASSSATPATGPTPAVTPSTNVDLSSLPYSSGTDPSAHYTGDSDSTPLVWDSDSTGNQGLTWFDPKGSLCTGQRDDPADDADPMSCDELTTAPANGLWLNGVVAKTEGGGLGFDSPDPVDTRVFGLVRGPVTRVIVDLPLSGPMDAHLQPAPDGLGTLYWLTTRDYTIDAVPVGSVGTDGSGDNVYQREVTVYRGDTPVFHCRNLQCYDPILYPGT